VAVAGKIEMNAGGFAISVQDGWLERPRCVGEAEEESVTWKPMV
jgi:hypothetical protein